MAKGKLTPKQERFVQEYLVDLNATQAAIRAGYSEDTAKQQGSRLLTNVDVAERLATKQSKIADKYEVTAERVIRELALIGFANMLDYIKPDGEGSAFIDLSTVGRDQAAAISEFTVDVMGGDGEEKKAVTRTRFKLHSKQGALDLLGKHLGLFESAGDEALKEGLAALLQSGRKRAAETKTQSLH